MTKRAILLSCVLIGFSASAQAQTPKGKLGLSIKYYISWEAGFIDNYPSSPSKRSDNVYVSRDEYKNYPMTSFNLGVTYLRPLWKRLDLNAGAYFIYKAGEITTYDLVYSITTTQFLGEKVTHYFDYSGKTAYQITYLFFPATVRFNFLKASSPFLELGTLFSLGLSAKVDYDINFSTNIPSYSDGANNAFQVNDGEFDVSDQLNRIGFGLILGLGMKFTNFEVAARYFVRLTSPFEGYQSPTGGIMLLTSYYFKHL